MAIGRSGVIFTIDAVIALILMLGTLTLALQFVPEQRSVPTAEIASEDLVGALASIEVSESTSPLIQELIANGTITEDQYERSVLEYIAELWAFDETALAAQVIENVTYPALDEDATYTFLVGSETLASQGSSYPSLITRAARLVSGINKSQPVRGYTAKLFLTAADARSSSEYLYFDGLTGMGNITMRAYLPDNASVFNVTLELDAEADFALVINGNACGTYDVTGGNDYLADSFTVLETASCNFSTIFNDGENTIQANFVEGDFSEHYIAGGVLRIQYTSRTENTYLISNEGSYVRERIYLNGVNELVNLFSSFYFAGNVTNLTVYLHAENQAPENDFYVRIADKTVYRTNDTGTVDVLIGNSTISSYLSYAALSDVTVPIRIGHLESSLLNDSNADSDAMVTIESSTSMETCDFPYDGSFGSDCDASDTLITRMLAAQNATKQFVHVFLEESGNRMGLVDYHATVPNGQIVSLTDDAGFLLGEIDNTVGNTPNLCFTCAIAESADELRRDSNPSRRRAIVLMSDGYANRCYHGNPNCNPLGGMTQEEKALEEAIDEACDIYEQDRITIYTIAYGLGADTTGLKNISEDCTNGVHFNATNLSDLIDIYENISSQIQSLSYEEQIPVIEGSMNSTLYPDSYIEAVYDPTVTLGFGDLTVAGETATFTQNGTLGQLSVSDTASLREASVISYSGTKWTETGVIGTDAFYNLTVYGGNYTLIGDPFRINIPIGLFTNGTNDVRIALTNATFGSLSNKITYKTVINNTINAYSPVLDRGEGCHWTAPQENGVNFTIAIPSSYTGTKECHYANASYDDEDAYDVSAYNLFDELDIDDDGLLDIFLEEQDLTVESTLVEDVPSLWGPALFEVQVGR